MKSEPKATAKSSPARRPPGAPRVRARRVSRPRGPARPKSDHEGDRRLAMAVLGQFRLIFRSAKKHFQWVQDRTGVSGAQLWVLAELQRRPGIRVTDLARAMGIHQSTASNLIDPLEKRRLIQRDRSSKDQRVVHLSLTRAGRETIGRAPRPLEGVLPDALHSLGRADLVELQRRLDRLAQRMKVRDSSGKRMLLGDI
ncbi:MAG TPA: MarR family transcriptional regulator [Burkholderiaceae bacterium]|nr:MarR family transcriptional regulator [Burkholderiaceae bacterium]